MTTTVLIVDDEPGILATLSGVLSDEGYDTLTTGSGGDAVELYRTGRPDVVFLDIWLPDRDGLEVLQELRDLDPRSAVIMISVATPLLLLAPPFREEPVEEIPTQT